MGDMIGDMMKKALIRAVLDTNILVAAVRSSSGASFAIVQALRAQQFIAACSVPLFLEYESVLLRPEQIELSGNTQAEMIDFLDVLAGLIEPINLHYTWRPQSKDPDDEMVLETALNGRVSALVSLNARDLAGVKNFGIRLNNPAQFLQLIRAPNIHILKGTTWPTTP